MSVAGEKEWENGTREIFLTKVITHVRMWPMEGNERSFAACCQKAASEIGSLAESDLHEFPDILRALTACLNVAILSGDEEGIAKWLRLMTSDEMSGVLRGALPSRTSPSA
jgi:hypothetical protein